MIKELVLIKLIKEALRQRITKARIIYLQHFLVKAPLIERWLIMIKCDKIVIPVVATVPGLATLGGFDPIVWILIEHIVIVPELIIPLHQLGSQDHA